nr:hypothetical protein [Marivibrio halodurans]
MRHQHLAAILRLGIAIAQNGAETVITALHTDAHFLRHLPSILLALKLALRGGDGLEKQALGAILEIVIEALAHRAALIHDASQAQMELGIAGIALEIIEDHHETLIGAGIEIGEQGHHAGAVDEIAFAGDIIGKDRFHLVALGLGILAAAVFLTIQPVAIRILFPVRDAAIDDRLARRLGVHNQMVHVSSLSARLSSVAARGSGWFSCK